MNELKRIAEDLKFLKKMMKKVENKNNLTALEKKYCELEEQYMKLYYGNDK